MGTLSEQRSEVATDALVGVTRHGDQGEIAVLTLNRPGALNAMNDGLVAAMAEALDAAAADDTIKVVMVTGAGRAFCVGGDLKDFLSIQGDAIAFPAFVDRYIALCDRIRALPKPVIALINGVCVAGGLELVLACDLAVAARSASIGDAHLNYAQVGGAGAMTRLPRLIGPARTKELVFSSRVLSAEEAHEWGLVNDVFDDGELLASGLAVAAPIAAKSARALATVKTMIDVCGAAPIPEAARLEREYALRFCLTDPDAAEGIRAFSERRTPVWPAAAHHPTSAPSA
ncbi:enoyl-CoA hydratase/isomerase family protein [Granulicoccus phenolivorans]|uniref:enoyl-CoA hydratase/isomerase family protein n=1 Tax=Granulicoccus phenolivorans TaxID=266854 RepID=UPI0004013CA8|nr:enoyl-CoA hydratase/isomerase family protein [Granulicoccus phenolivorans]